MKPRFQRRSVLGGLLGLASRPGLALAGLIVPACAHAAAAMSKVSLAPLPLQQRRLANGLAVVLIPGASTTMASVQVWYRVGGKDDPAGRSGFAHLFEHLMFKRTRYMPDEMFDRLTEDVGGNNNAFTAEDTTAYHSEVPGNHVERLLWAEAERMAHLDVDQAQFESERKVVEEELRQRVLADPYGRLMDALPREAFAVHPYRRPAIGSIEDLDAATLADVRQFHATFYRPDNAILVVAGDIEVATTQRWIDRYFGPLTAPAEPIPRVTLVEPRRTAARHLKLQAPNVPLPAVALLWQGPRAAHADAAALKVASALLAGSDSSRLNEAMVYREQSAQAVGFDAELYADAGMIAAYAIGAAKQTPATLARSLRREIEKLARSGPSAAEIDTVRTRMLTAAVAARQTPQGQASAVGWAMLLRGDARDADLELARLQAVDAPAVRRVLTQILASPAVTIDYTRAA
jgi:zinc protease